MRLALLTLFLTSLPAAGAEPFHPPLIRDFLGLNVHTVQFRPDLYRPICRLLRDYHPVQWDLGDDSAHPTTFPLAANRVDWSTLYGQWTKTGYEVDACLMFDESHEKAATGLARTLRRFASKPELRASMRAAARRAAMPVWRDTITHFREVLEERG